jgi:hypothetical protein
MWRDGDQILIRHVHPARVVQALPATVAEFRPEQVATWIAPGTPIVYPRALRNEVLLPPDEWGVDRRNWFGTGVLDLTRPGRAHMIRHFWSPEARFRGWYVNLQDPLVWTARGWDTTDQQLDLWVYPDGSHTWRDEDHLEQAVEHGMFTPDEAEAVWAEGRRVLDEWPFPTGWEEWRPDPDWPVPELPDDWDAR